LAKKVKIKRLLKEIHSLVLQKKTEEAKKVVPTAYKLLDKAAKTGLIKKNTVSRRKSVITRLINRLNSA